MKREPGVLFESDIFRDTNPLVDHWGFGTGMLCTSELAPCRVIEFTVLSVVALPIITAMDGFLGNTDTCARLFSVGLNTFREFTVLVPITFRVTGAGRDDDRTGSWAHMWIWVLAHPSSTAIAVG